MGQSDTSAKKIVIVGATSGIGLEVARRCIAAGWQVGAAGRRTEALEQLRLSAPGQVVVQPMDITRKEAPEQLSQLVERLGGMECYLHVAGVGNQNPELDPAIELRTVQTNTEGFTRLVTAAFNYFARRGEGHIAAVTSIAGTRGLGSAPSYSASKRFQNIYLDSLAQLARIRRLHIRFTDIRPGFVDTDLLSDGHRYPMLMRPERVAARILKALTHRERRVVIDRRYALLVFCWRILPQWLWERLPIRTKRRTE